MLAEFGGLELLWGILFSLPILVLLLVAWSLVILPTIRWLNRTWLNREWRMARRIRRKLRALTNSQLEGRFTKTPVANEKPAQNIVDKSGQIITER